MTGRPRAARAGPRLAAAALLALAACHHENPPTPVPVLHAVDVSAASLATEEGGAPAWFDVVLRSRPSVPVDVEVRSGDPSEGLLLTGGASAPTPVLELTFTPADWDVPRRVAVHPVDDHEVDGTVRYEIALRVAYTEDAAYAQVSPVAVAVASSDDDAVGFTLSTHALATSEGGAAATFSLRLDTVPSAAVWLTVTSGDSSEGSLALGGAAGCSSGSWSLAAVFEPGTWGGERTFAVCPMNDDSADGAQTYEVTVSVSGNAPEYASVAPQAVTITNADDDVADVLVDVPGSPLVTTEGGTAATFTVRLAAAPLGDVIIPVSSGDPGEGLVASGAAGPAASVDLAFGPGSWSFPQTVTVIGQDDAASPVVGDDVAYEISVGPPRGADPFYPSVPVRTVAVVNRDNDVPALTLVASAPLVTSEWGGAASFTVSLGVRRASTVVVRATTSDPGEGLLLGPAGGTPEPSVDVAFSSADWETPRTITVVGQPDGVVDGNQVTAVTVSVVSGDADYVALAPQALPFTNVDDPSANTPLAIHDAALGAPACAAVGSGCSTGALVVGRGPNVGPTSAGEPNQPNTLADPATGGRCADGTGGTYLHDESLEALKVFTVDGSPLAPGRTVRIEARVFAFSATQNYLDLYFAADATAPVWTHLATLRAPAAGEQVLAFTYTLPAGTLQAIRGGWRYNGAVATCTTGSYDDRDDLVFAVSPSPPGPPP